MISKNEIYLDNAATTSVSPQVAAVINDVMLNCYGNPSSLHKKGLEARLLLDKAAKQIGESLGVNADNVLFTSGGTEADNLAVIGAAMAKKRRGNRIVTTAIEHSAVLASTKYLESLGFEVITIQPKNGQILAADIVDAVNDNTVLVSMMAVNNETGCTLPVNEAAKAIRRKNNDTLIHCDSVACYGKIPLKIGSSLDIDLLSLSGHKIHAPKGIGALIVKKGVRILPRSYGGSQGKGLRTGTEPLPLACGLAKASEIAINNIGKNQANFTMLNNYLTNKLLEIDNVCINSPANSAPFIVNASILGIRSEIMLHFLESKEIYLSSGSACSKGAKSHVLTAMGIDHKIIDSALRISFCDYTTTQQLDTFIAAIREGIATIRR
ncbi:MAG: cysteine desulfurase family protein [Oscillospiraceae bacterium]